MRELITDHTIHAVGSTGLFGKNVKATVVPTLPQKMKPEKNCFLFFLLGVCFESWLGCRGPRNSRYMTHRDDSMCPTKKLCKDKKRSCV